MNWRKLFLYFLLVNFLNTAIFSAENVDDDPYDGVEEVGQEEFNTVIEYVVEDFLGHTDQTPEDEDDDAPDNYKFDKQPDACQYYQVLLSENPLNERLTINFFYLSVFQSITKEVNSPPPKQA